LNESNCPDQLHFLSKADSESKQLPYGYPRVKYLLDHVNDESYICNLKAKYDISQDKRIVVYLPTWRDCNYGKKDHFDLSYLINLSLLQAQLGDEYEIIYKDHAYLSKPENISFKNYSTAETQELLLIADYLITDYSSVMFDAFAMNLPVIIYCNDYEQNEQDRGVYQEIWQDLQPFVCTEVEQVTKMIQDYQIDDHFDTVKAKYGYNNDAQNLSTFILEL